MTALAGLLGMVPRRVLWLLLALALALLAADESRLAAARVRAAEAAATLQTERATAAQAAADLQAEYRQTEQLRAKRMEDTQREYDQRLAALRDDAARAADAARRLRAQLAVITAVASSSAPSHPDPAGDSAAAATDPGVLADVLGQCVERVRALAAAADAGRAAGEQCAASYDSLSPGL